MNDNAAPAPTPSRLSRGAERGQSLVEFALMGTLLLLLLTGILDLGRAYYTFLQLKDAAAEGAYFAMKYPDQWCDPANLQPQDIACTGYEFEDPNNIYYRVRNSAPAGGLVDWSATTITVAMAPGAQPGDAITVTVTYPYRVITPFIGAIIGGQTLNLRATTVSTIITPP